MNIRSIHCIENIFTVQDFWATCACFQKQSFPAKFSLCRIYFLPFKTFEQLCAYPENQSSPWNVSLYSIEWLLNHCSEMDFLHSGFFFLHSGFYIQDFLATCACPEFAVLDIYFLQWRAVRFVTGEALSLSTPNLRLYELSSINSPLNWLLAEWLLLMLSTPYHNLLHTYRHNGDSRFAKSNI